jgi:hypothetical protein
MNTCPDIFDAVAVAAVAGLAVATLPQDNQILFFIGIGVTAVATLVAFLLPLYWCEEW